MAKLLSSEDDPTVFVLNSWLAGIRTDEMVYPAEWAPLVLELYEVLDEYLVVRMSPFT